MQRVKLTCLVKFAVLLNVCLTINALKLCNSVLMLMALYVSPQMLRAWWTASCLCCWSWRQTSRRLLLKVYVRSLWSSVKERDPPSECSCESHRVLSLKTFKIRGCLFNCNYVICFTFWCHRLSNLFHGMDENTPVRYTVFCSLIKVAATCNAISFIPTDLDQVYTFMVINPYDWPNTL